MVSLGVPANDHLPADGAAALSPRQRSDRAAQRITALGEMTTGIAHDFRIVLAIIDSSLSLAERNSEDAVALHSYLLAAREGVSRGMRLSSRLLAFAKKRSSDAHAEDINGLIEAMKTFVKYGAGPGTRVEFALSPDLPPCFVDPQQFNAAILNLVVNARDAMPAGGTIRIGTSLVGGASTVGQERASACVRVRVEDAGTGIPQPSIDRIFDPYFTTKGENGTGLGLPQVKACMDQVGGSLEVHSELGRGTSIDLLFPACDRPG